MEYYERIGHGANPSEEDPRTVKHEDLVMGTAPLIKGGITYVPSDIEHQHLVGICTAISLIQNREKANGKKYSPEFQYLLQKKYYDNNWYEGSAILYALKVATKYGLLPAELWTYTTEQDRYLPYNQYIAKLQAVSDADISRLITLCIDKIPGYAMVDVTDPQAIARAINESEAGILCRYDCGNTWWTSKSGVNSWAPADIDPLRKPVPATSGHAISTCFFDYTAGYMLTHPNTWGILWDMLGQGHTNWSNYPMAEAWVILRSAPQINPYPTLRRGANCSLVKDLQTKLNAKNHCNLGIDGIFGQQTLDQVIYFQKLHKLVADGIVGPKTWAALNQ